MSSDYLNILKSAKIETLNIPSDFKFSPNENQIGVSVVPPCTADIRFKVGKFSVQQPRFSLTKRDLDLPTHWENFSNDKNTKNKKLLRSLRPVNQGKCGSCFAVAIATTLSDNFLFGMDLNYNPALSPMYILSCLSVKDPNYNSICGGGNPSGVVDDVIQNGIATNCCIDYYKICDKNIYCSGDGKSHLDSTPVTLQQRNSIIDGLDCDCCTDGVHKLYKVKNKVISYSVPDIKHHLMKYGAAVGGFLVYKNFIKDVNTGKFKETNGIYIKSVNYSGEANHIGELLGGHAISIVGWGSEKISFKAIKENSDSDTEYDEYKDVNVDYWVCRNSWGQKWGDNGYFKYAMHKTFPDSTLPDINKDVAFEINTSIGDQPGLGGIILMFPDSIEDGMLKKSLTCNEDYKCEEGKDENENDVGDGDKFILSLKEHVFTNSVLYICLSLIIFICLYYIFFHTSAGKKKRRHKIE